MATNTKPPKSQNRLPFNTQPHTRAVNTNLALTLKQEKFCHEYLKTGNASAAYRQVYNTSKMKKTTIGRKAFELLENGKITANINKLKAPGIKAAELTVENHLLTLEQMRQAAFEAGNYTAAIRAEELKGKVGGFYVDRLETSTDVRCIVFEDHLVIGKKQKLATEKRKDNKK